MNDELPGWFCVYILEQLFCVNLACSYGYLIEEVIMDYATSRGPDHVGPVKVVGPVTKCPGCIGRERILARPLKKIGERFTHEPCGTTILVVPVDLGNRPVQAPEQRAVVRHAAAAVRADRQRTVDAIVSYVQGRQSAPNGSI